MACLEITRASSFQINQNGLEEVNDLNVFPLHQLSSKAILYLSSIEDKGDDFAQVERTHNIM